MYSLSSCDASLSTAVFSVWDAVKLAPSSHTQPDTFRKCQPVEASSYPPEVSPHHSQFLTHTCRNTFVNTLSGAQQVSLFPRAAQHSRMGWRRCFPGRRWITAPLCMPHTPIRCQKSWMLAFLTQLSVFETLQLLWSRCSIVLTISGWLQVIEHLIWAKKLFESTLFLYRCKI